MNIPAFFDPGHWNLAGWTMLHTFWISLLIGAAALITRLIIRRCSAQIRYSIALGWFALLSVLPFPVAWRVWQAEAGHRLQATGSRNAVEQPTSEAKTEFVAFEQDSALTAETALIAQPNIASENDRADERATSEVSVSSPRPPVTASPRLPPTEFRWSTRIAAQLQSAINALPWLWFVGTPLTFLLLASGLLGAERLRRQSRRLEDEHILGTLTRLSSQLQLRLHVTIGVCDRIAGPILVGIVRPMILLPAAALCHWSPEQLEMVLWHELSHVRRWDNLVNLLQRIVEALLFFVPTVWMVSRWVRQEREHCCDRCVVAQTGRPREYAETLVQIADRRLAPRAPARTRLSNLVASPMAEHQLLARVRHILKHKEESMKVSSTLFGSVVILMATLIAFAGWYGATSTKAQENASDPSAESPRAETSDEKTPNVETPKPAIDAPVNLKTTQEERVDTKRTAEQPHPPMPMEIVADVKLESPPKQSQDRSSAKATNFEAKGGGRRDKDDAPAVKIFEVHFLDDVTISSDRLRVLASIDVQSGDVVPKGKVLAQSAREDFEKAKTEFHIAELHRSNAQREFDRAKILTEKMAMTSTELARKKAEFELAELNLRAETLKLYEAEKQIIAPFAGTIVEVFKRAGETVKPGDPIVRIVNTDRFAVEGFIDLLHNPTPKRGEAFRFTLLGDYLPGSTNDSVFEGKIDFISPEFEPNSYSLKIRGTIENRDGVLRAGMRGVFQIGQPALQGAVTPEEPPKAKLGSGTGWVPMALGALFAPSRDGEKLAQLANTQFRNGLKFESVDPKGPVGRVGIHEGDILVGLMKWETSTFENLNYVLNHPDVKLLEPITFHILRDGRVLRGQFTIDQKYFDENAYSRFPGRKTY